jgi:hypothetical protein
MYCLCRPEPDQRGESETKRKRKDQDEDTENSTTLANTPSPSPISGCHGDGGRRPPPRNGQYHRSNGRPKRRRLSHSSYSITIDEDPLDTFPAKVTIIVVVQPVK